MAYILHFNPSDPRSNRRLYFVVNNMDAMLAGTDTFDKGLASETLKYSVIIVATVPILTLYPFLQKYFVKGMMIGALKG